MRARSLLVATPLLAACACAASAPTTSAWYTSTEGTVTPWAARDECLLVLRDRHDLSPRQRRRATHDCYEKYDPAVP